VSDRSPDPFERVLRLVAEGRLTADEAAPILDALSARDDAAQATGSERPRHPESPRGPAPVAAIAPVAPSTPAGPGSPGGGGPQWARIQVMESGRRVVDLRIPTSLGRFALGRVPGLSTEQVGELQRAISSGLVGPLLEVEDTDGDGVRIVLE
jgi:hypothetical protein